ncbi:hypothetical protein RN001_014214 [Aquatica leii]|uniref:Luc7-like protein 3 n=1 Tax=Aquatica leii TaxID=1421715 RepID=A0AAN7P1A1_9COLE|nr:hypothetical protein RN001_014214 [Aquatica leii]
MAVLAAAALLDELMGRNRNVLPNEKVKELNWEDSEYCKYFLVKFCPHDLFVNTKADLGTCPKVHDEEVRKLFEKAKGHRKVQYQEEFIRFCSNMVNEVERRIQKGRQRLALNSKQEITPSNPAQIQRNQEQINILNERINGLEKEAEQAGNDGNVEQAQGLMKLCDQLKEERDILKKQNENGHWSATAELAAAQEKQMEVCEVCGAFLIVGDAQQRIDDHLMGKQHVGYARLKTAIEEVTTAIQSSRDERRSLRDDKKDRDNIKEVDKIRKKEVDRTHKEYRDRSDYRSERVSIDRRDKDKNREKRDKDERRERDRERDKQRDRERDRRHRDRERETVFVAARSSRHSHHRR